MKGHDLFFILGFLCVRDTGRSGNKITGVLSLALVLNVQSLKNTVLPFLRSRASKLLTLSEEVCVAFLTA